MKRFSILTIRRKLIVISCIIILCFFGDCVKEGPSGKNSLINIVQEPSGINCASGGLKIMSGLDINENKYLDNDEVKVTYYSCNAINSIIQYKPEPNGVNCPAGGYIVNSGMDMNANKILDANEIQSTAYICNGTSAEFDNEIILFITFGNYANDSTTGLAMLGIPEFNISNYLNVDSVAFGSYLKSDNSNNTCFLELYDLTHNTTIANTVLSSNSTNYEWKTTSINFLNNLPKNPFSLGIILRSQTNGTNVTITHPQIRLYR